MVNPVRRHAWGSPNAIPALLGLEPDGGPYAELWLSGYESESSTVSIGDHDELLCKVAANLPGGRLPFLAKVLAMGSPLSLQLHPGPFEQPRDKHRVAKPEMLFALEPCAVLCGFRRAHDAAAMLSQLDVDGLARVTAAVRPAHQESLRDAIKELLRLPDPAPVVRDTQAALGTCAEVGLKSTRAAVAALAHHHPGDGAALIPLLMEIVHLGRGEAMFCSPGQPHTYLSGLGFEVQANSDEVLRGGLTSKPVDVTRFLAALDTAAGARRVLPRPEGGEHVYDAGVAEFALAAIRSVDGRLASVGGPQLLMCTSGSFTLRDAESTHLLLPGRSVYVSPSQRWLSASGDGLLLRVTQGRAG